MSEVGVGAWERGAGRGGGYFLSRGCGRIQRQRDLVDGHGV